MNKKGFTLIELLVVITIIGLMISIVMVNLQNPGAKAHDANIKKFMHDLRNAAQISYNISGDYDEVCDDTDGTLNGIGDFKHLEESLKKENEGEEITCMESANKAAFAASFPMVAVKSKHWCVESAGAAVEIDNPTTSELCR